MAEDKPKDRPPEMDKLKEGLAALKAGDPESAQKLLEQAREIQKQDGRD